MKTFIISITTIACAFKAQSQTTDSAQVAVMADTVQKKSILTIGSVYANNANYYGQKSTEAMPYIALAAAYQHHSGFYISAMGYRLLKDSVKLGSAYSVGLGYRFNMGQSVELDLSYDYSIYPINSPFLQAANPHSANITLSHTSFLTSSISGDYAFGKTNDLFVTPEISKDIDLFSIGKADIITLSPSVSASAGTQHFYEYYLKEKTLRDSLMGILIPPVLGEASSEEPVAKMKSSFDILSYNMKLPLSYNRNHFKAELSAQFSLLSDKAATNPGKLNRFFGVALYYQF